MDESMGLSQGYWLGQIDGLLKYRSPGQNYRTGKVLVLHKAVPGSVPSIQYGIMSPTRNSEPGEDSDNCQEYNAALHSSIQE